MGRRLKGSQGQNRTGESPPSGIAGGACGNVDHGGTRHPPRLSKERVLETLCLQLRAPQIYPDRWFEGTCSGRIAYITRMKELTTSDRPESITLDVSGRQVVFVRGADDQYAAELDGKRLPIRTKREVRDVSEAGSHPLWEPKVREGETANIDALLYCLSLGPERKSAIPHSVMLKARDNWGQFRQWTFLTISVTIAPSGIVELHEDIGEENGSYY